MNTHTILHKILSDEELKKYWLEITTVNSENINTIKNYNNIYLKYIHTVLIDESINDRARINIVTRLIE